jgi:hypothetical protein
MSRERRAPRGITPSTGSNQAREEHEHGRPKPQHSQDSGQRGTAARPELAGHAIVTATVKSGGPCLSWSRRETGKGADRVVDNSVEQQAVNGVLYLVVSGAPAPEGIPALIERCQAAGWRVLVFSTPAGVMFVDSGELERLTGEPVRAEYRMPGTGKSVPPADAVLACPLTFNSVNKFAHGHADNFAVALLCEMTGYEVPIVVVPHCKPQLASHPAFAASIQTLRDMGIKILFDPDAPYGRRLPPWSDVQAALPVQAVPK